MKKPRPKPKPNKLPVEILQDFTITQFLPDEDPQIFESLRDALYLDLAPGTPYERVLAEQLVSLEWETMRHRRLRDSLLISEFRELSVGAFQNGNVGRVSEYERTEEAENFSIDLVCATKTRRQRAVRELQKYEISQSEILAKAYSLLSVSLEPHESYIIIADGRRRKLMVDYNLLKSARAKPTEDAEIVGQS